MSKTVFITGATAGFGQAMARRYAKEGWQVVATGRRAENLTALAKELSPAPVHTICFDVRDKSAVQRAVADLPEQFAAIDVLVNNAGLSLGMDPAQSCDMEDWECMVDTNVKGLLYVTHAILPGMVERNRGHVVNLGSVAGSYPYRGGNTYGGTKAFVNQFSKNLLADLLGTSVRVTNIEPGLCETEFSIIRFHGDKDKAASVYEGTEPLVADDIADIIYWTTTLPAHININNLEVMPVDQSFAGFAIHRTRTN